MPASHGIERAAWMTVLEVLSLSATLEQCEEEGSLEPANPRCARSLYRLEQIALHTPEDRAAIVMADPRIRKKAPILRRIMAEAEREAEKHYAAEALHRAIPHCSQDATVAEKNNLLSSLIENYHRAYNYIKTVYWELKLFKEQPLTGDSRLVFAGSGSLPMTPFLLHVNTNASITCIDNDREAVAKSLKLVDRLESAGVLEPGKVKVVHADAQRFNYRDHDMVFIASLIPNDVKGAIAKAIGNTRQDPACVAVRSGEDLVELLYENVDPIVMSHDRLKEQTRMKPWRRGESSVLEVNAEPGRVRTIISDSEIFNTTHLYLANVGDLPKNRTPLRSSNPHNWGDKGTRSFDPRSIGARAR